MFLTGLCRLVGEPPARVALRAGLAGLLAGAALALATPARAQTGVPADWSLKPTALAAGAPFRLLFLSSTNRVGSDTDIADYNTFIQDLAAAGHADIQAYSAGFRVVGCTADTDARDNTSTTGTGVPIYWLNGGKVADNYADFYDGYWWNEANDKNESGTDGPDTSSGSYYPITGCDHDGTEVFAGSNSRALGASTVRVGRPNSTADRYHGPLSNRATNTLGSGPMYGLSAVFKAVAGLTPPTIVTVTFDAATYTATEGGTAATVKVQLDTEPGGSLVIPLTVTSTDGAWPHDYTLPASVTFTSNQTEQTFTITAVDDMVDENNETLTLAFGELPPGAREGVRVSATVTLADDDTEAGAPSVTGVALTSQPRRNRIYRRGEEIEVRVQFDKHATVTGTPQIGLTIGTNTRQARYQAARSAGEVVVFAYTVVSGESDADGISIAADSLALNGGMIQDTADQTATLTHTAVAADSRHAVDAAKPVLQTATVDGPTVTLTYDEPLHEGSLYHNLFTVTVAGNKVPIYGRVRASGPTVSLLLGWHGNWHVALGQAVTVSYEPSWISMVQDPFGNTADAFPEQAVMNNTPAVLYDTNPNGLLEITTLAQLNAIRYDPDGDGNPTDAGETAYRAAFDFPATDRRLACGARLGCSGYELMKDLDFLDTNGDGQVNTDDDTNEDPYWNDGAGWQPIGTENSPYRATFTGHGHTIRNLFIYRPTEDRVGLFGSMTSYGYIRYVGLTNVDVEGRDFVGGLVGYQDAGKIRVSYATGRVSGGDSVGGLVGFSVGAETCIWTSYATVNVSGESSVGGLVGYKGRVCRFQDSYATGNSPDWIITYDSYWDTGAAGQNPALKVDFNGDGRATWQEFGYQLRAGPQLTVTEEGGQVVLRWTAVDTSHWQPAPGVTYAVYRTHENATVLLADGVDGLTYTDPAAPTEGTTYQVAAVVNGGEAVRSALAVVSPPNDARLRNLAISPGTLNEPFASGTVRYTASVRNDLARLTVTPVTNNPNATVAFLDGRDNTLADADTSSAPTFEVDLAVGATVVKVQVTAQDRTTTQTYTVTVTRAPPPSSDATLSGLAISPGTLNEPFASGTVRYTASVRNDLARLTVTPVTNNPNATVAFLDGRDNTLADADTSSAPTFEVDLAVGATVVKVQVTAQDRTTTQTYTVTVTRAPPPSSDTLPTAADGAVSATQDTVYTFAATDFNFRDADGDTLASVQILSLPAAGTGALAFDGAEIDAAALPKTVTTAALEDGRLTYTPPAGQTGTDLATFTFTVNDGTNDSTSPSTLTLDITAAGGTSRPGGGGSGGDSSGDSGGGGGGSGGGSSGRGGGGGGRSAPEPLPEPVGYLENPGAASPQSGIGLISGWTCEAEEVEIEIETARGTTVRQRAAYGTERADTEAECGDIDNGFGLLFNWNLLGDGEHEVVAFVDGVELGRATVTVTTLGQEFLRDVTGTCEASDFPTLGERVTLVWQQTSQNFVIANGAAPRGATRAGRAGVGYLENPGPNAFQSGVGVISGWVCEADEVEVAIGHLGRQLAAYGTERLDTLDACGDTDNGFGLLFNWNLLGDGEHEVAAFVNGEELGRATVRVTTLGVEFLREVEGECVADDFPRPGQRVLLEWQQNSQNFVITEVE